MSKLAATSMQQSNCTAAEWQARIELAAAFRIAHHLGWNDRTINHITARVPDEPDHFLMNSQGLGWHEITASNLVKADFRGNIIGATGVKLAPAGLNFHSAILEAKPHLNCVIHTHPIVGVVISATKSGLIIVDQTSCQLQGQVAYHDFEGFADDKGEAPRIIADLGDKLTMIMWNHGLLSVGRTIGEAFAYMRKLVTACEIQERLSAMGVEIRAIPEEVLARTVAQNEVRRSNKPYGEDEWKMCLRLAEDLDPRFKN